MTLTQHITAKHTETLNEIIANAKIDTPLVAVYCGSKAGNNPIYQEVGRQVGQALVCSGLGLVYGGASIGVMGAVADGVREQKGIAVGVIPEFLLQKEIAHANLTTLYTTDTMHTRKALMAGFACAFVVLSGGFGTLEEMMEVATWGQLYQHNKPILLVNTNGFYDHLIAHLEHTVTEGFMSERDLARVVVCQTVDEMIERLQGTISQHQPIDIEKF